MISGVQLAERDDARRGALYFLGKTNIEPSASVDLGIVSNLIGSTEIAVDMKNAALSLLPKRVTDTLNLSTEMFGKVVTLFTDFFESIKRKMIDMFGEALIGVEFVGEFLSWALSSLVGSLASLVPGWGYVQSASDLYSGIKKSVLNAKDFINNLWSGRGVQLLDGAPQDIADALARHSAVGVAGGLKDAGIASVSIGLEAAGDAAGGAGMIVSVVTGLLQRIANIIDWCIQKFRMKAVLSAAADAWILKDDSHSLCNDHAAFSAWFRRAVLLTPIVAALVLHSGFVAHPYRFLLLIEPGDVITSQAAFDKGVLYIEKLKAIAAGYIRSYTDTYRVTFTSGDQLVAARLKNVWL